METTETHVSIESHDTKESKLVLEGMVGDRRPQHIDTDKDWWKKKMTKTYRQPSTKKRKSPVDSSMIEEQEEEEEGEFSSSEQLLFKNLSEAITDYHQEPLERCRHQGRARSNSPERALEMASQLHRNPSSEEPIIPSKRRRYERRSSFMIRHDKNMPFPPRSLLLLEGDEDDDEDRPLNRSAQNLFRSKPELPSDIQGNLSWSNTNDTAWYNRFSSMSFEAAEPLIPEPPSKSDSSS
jgi:hypothetical protein